VVEHLPGKLEALHSNPVSTITKLLMKGRRYDKKNPTDSKWYENPRRDGGHG
jgi:hypothetical protein